jgi:hypothetical protein
MAQLSPSQYKQLSKGVTYGVSYGIYWDATNSLLVLAVNDAVVFSIDSSGTILSGALEAADLNISGQARGDLLRRGASAWERVSAKTSGQILVGDGTDVVSVAVSGDATLASTGALTLAANSVDSAEITAGSVDQAHLSKPRLRCVEETLTAASLVDGGAAVGTKTLTAAIPAGARYLYTTITAITGFAGDTSAVITLGDGSDVDRYNTGTPDIFTTAAAGVDMGAPSGTAFHATAVAGIVATVTSAADITLVLAGGGSCNLKFWFLEPI